MIFILGFFKKLDSLKCLQTKQYIGFDITTTSTLQIYAKQLENLFEIVFHR